MKKNILNANKKLLEQIEKHFGNKIELYLFGSVARKDYDTFSDIDILLLLPIEVNNTIREKVFNMAYDIELEYDVIFGIIVQSKKFWNSEIAKVMPIYQNIQKEGIRL